MRRREVQCYKIMSRHKSSVNESRCRSPRESVHSTTNVTPMKVALLSTFIRKGTFRSPGTAGQCVLLRMRASGLRLSKVTSSATEPSTALPRKYSPCLASPRTTNQRGLMTGSRLLGLTLSTVVILIRASIRNGHEITRQITRSTTAVLRQNTALNTTNKIAMTTLTHPAGSSRKISTIDSHMERIYRGIEDATY